MANALLLSLTDSIPTCLKPYFTAISERKRTKCIPFPYTLFSKADSGYNQAIRGKYAFYSADAQIQIYPLVSSGDYNIIRSEIHKGKTVLKPPHQVAIYFFPYFFVLVHIFAVYDCLNPRFGFFFIFFFIEICSSSLLLVSGVSKPNAEDKPKSGRLTDCLSSFLFS